MWVVARRPIDEHHADAMPLELFEDDHLVYVVARQTVWSGNQHHVEIWPVPPGRARRPGQAAGAWLRCDRHLGRCAAPRSPNQGGPLRRRARARLAVRSSGLAAAAPSTLARRTLFA